MTPQRWKALLFACVAGVALSAAASISVASAQSVKEADHADSETEADHGADVPPPVAPAPDATASKAKADKWSDSEIAEGRARCAAILQRIHATAIAHDPIKQGACGAPAPIELVTIGQNPQVALSPPPIITCNLAEGLATWVEKDLQPLAKKYFHSPIVTINTMSSYSCRNAYGRKKSKLSEHARANALDIRGFVTASATTAAVLEDWGTPQREIVARLAAEKAAAAKRAAELAATNQRNAASVAADAADTEGPAAEPTSPSAAAIGIRRTTIVEGIPRLTFPLGGSATPTSETALSIAEPDRLGGPVPKTDLRLKPWTVVAVQSDDMSPRERAAREFLHQAHATACRIFGTTMGPEANATHRNHIHVDMALRPIIKICD